MILDNVFTFSTDNELFIAKGERFLLKIVGEDRKLLEVLLSAYNDVQSENSVFEKLKDQFNFDRGHFDLMVGFLKDQGILITQNENSIVSPLNIKILCCCDDIEAVNSLSTNIFSSLNKDYILTIQDIRSYKCDIDSDEKTDMAIVFSPLFETENRIREISSFFYSKDIPVIHGGVEITSIILGPIISPAFNTPSLNCYIQRKRTGMQNFDKFLQVTKLRSTSENSIKLTKNKYFRILLEYIALEIDNFFSENYSGLIAREVEFDFINYISYNTKILKTRTFDEDILTFYSNKT